MRNINRHHKIFIKDDSLVWWAFLWCWAGLPPAVLDPSVLDERVGINLIVTHLDLACAQTTPRLPKKPWSRAHDRRSCYGRVMASQCNKNNKRNTFAT